MAKSFWNMQPYSDNVDTEAAEPLNGDADKVDIYPKAPKKDLTVKRLVFANIVLFTFSCLILLKVYTLSPARHERNWLLKASSEHSPLFDLLDIPLVTKQVNGTLLPNDPVPIYRQPPSPEVDAAWDRISTRNPIVFSRSDIIAMGKDPEDAAKWPADWYGPDKYIGKVDAFHQIHCLDRIRRSLIWNFGYYYGNEFPRGTPINKYHTYHVDHCVYVLLQNIQCAASVDVYPQIWMDAQKYPFPDFNINKKCRDFDVLLDWQEKNSIDIEEVTRIKPEADSKIHIMNHEFKEVVRWYDDHPDDHIVGGEIG